MIQRLLSKLIQERFFKGKAILLLGPRQVGKSTMIESLISGRDDVMEMNGDDTDVRAFLSQASVTSLKAAIGSRKILFIDEAQRIKNIGIALKIITDRIKDVQVIATGSSSFELSNNVNEPLTGRKFEFLMYPLSFEEMVNHHGLLEEKRLLEHRMIYGYYPEVVTQPGEERERLQLLANSYLYKDVLMLDQVQKPALLESLLRALALQVGSEVNFQEVAQMIGSDRKTVEKYVDILQKAFVLFVVPAYSRNVRNEIKKGKKIYFYDCGIRNAIINNFKPLSTRTDVGAIWENFIIAERMKFLHYHNLRTKHYFWRTTQQQEIDLIEESEDGLNAVEIKWNPINKVRIPLTFTANYPGSKSQVITKDEFDSFIK